MKELVICREVVKKVPQTVKKRGEDGMWYRQQVLRDTRLLSFYLVVGASEYWLFDEENITRQLTTYFCAGRPTVDLQRYKPTRSKGKLSKVIAHALRAVEYLEKYEMSPL